MSEKDGRGKRREKRLKLLYIKYYLCYNYIMMIPVTETEGILRRTGREKEGRDPQESCYISRYSDTVFRCRDKQYNKYRTGTAVSVIKEIIRHKKCRKENKRYEQRRQAEKPQEVQGKV